MNLKDKQKNDVSIVANGTRMKRIFADNKKNPLNPPHPRSIGDKIFIPPLALLPDWSAKLA